MMWSRDIMRLLYATRRDDRAAATSAATAAVTAVTVAPDELNHDATEEHIFGELTLSFADLLTHLHPSPL